MIDPLDYDNRPFFKALKQKRKSAFWVLTLERIILHTWRLFFWVLFFCGLWMLGVPEFLGSWAEIIALIIFLVGGSYLIRTDILSFKRPEPRDIDKALERSSAMPQGYIAFLKDTLSNPKKHSTRDLWKTAQINVLHSLKGLKTPRKRALLSREDPSALRYIALLLFITGWLFAGSTWTDRILNGLAPIQFSSVVSQGQKTHIWITPPAYTQEPQTHLSGNGTFTDTLNIPEGSEIKIRTYSMLGKFMPPYLQNGDNEEDLDYIGEGLYGAQTEIATGDTLRLKQGVFSRLTIPYSYIIDQPPKISTAQPEQDEEAGKAPSPEADAKPEPYEIISKGEVRFPLEVEDDYGVKELHVKMTLNDMVETKPLGEDFEDTRLVMSRPKTPFQISPVYDMSGHTWAGLPVTFTFIAIDHKGQTAELEPINLTLPEREFKHPLAESLIHLRKRLAWDYEDDFTETAETLNTLLSATDYYQGDPMIFLALRVSALRLHYNNDKPQYMRTQAAREVIDILWEIAIQLEDGNLAMAMRELNESRRALENAMRDPNANPDEIAKLMDDVREKMAQYFMELQRDMQKRMQNGEDFTMLEPDQFSEFISPDSIANLMDQIESALRAGDQEKANELMSQLQRMMEMMDPSMTPRLPRDMQTMKKGVNELQELIKRQEALRDQTLEQAEMQGNINLQNHMDALPNMTPTPSLQDMLKVFGMENAPPKPDANQTQRTEDQTVIIDTSENKVEQEALRFILGQLMLEVSEHVGDIPESMGLAEQEMRGSSDALGENNPRKSVPHQNKAIEYLKQSQKDLREQLQSRMQQMVGLGFSGGQSYDPLGRPYGGDQDEQENGPHGSRVQIPDEAQKKKVDEILKTLRDRSGDRSRPQDELEYFRRLLRQF